MTKLAPGKGFHGVLTQEYLNFIQTALAEVALCYDDETHDTEPKTVQDRLLEMGTDEDGTEWQEEKDNFGRKVYVEKEYKEGMLRVTCVLSKQNELRLDIREWYTPAK